MKFSKLKSFVAVILTVSSMAFVNAQLTKPTAPENALLTAAIKRAETPKTKSVFYIDRKETTLDAVKNVSGDEVKGVKVLMGNDISKKWRAKGVTQIVMVTTKK